MPRIFLALLLAGLCVATVPARDVEETFPNGPVKLRYSVDAQGRKDGPAVEYHENGKIKVRSAYRAGLLDGPYSSFHDNGRPHVSASYQQGKLDGEYSERTATGDLRLTAGYRSGKLHGWRTGYLNGEVALAQAWKDGELIVARGPEWVRRKLAEIEEEPPAAAKLPAADRARAAALRRVRAYRFLAGVPYEDVELDDELNRCAQAASKICHKIGKLDHTPENPGLPEEEYRIAYKGTSGSNLFMGLSDLVKCVDGWMDDTDETNIVHLGHRRWCLNPALKKTGFGRTEDYVAMYVFDRSRKEVPDYDFISFPVRGVMPVEYFQAGYAWSISLNPKKYQPLKDTTRVKVTPLDARFEPAGPALAVAGLHFDNEGFGVPRCVIFQPRKVAVAPGVRYWVELEGIQTAEGKPTALRFLIEFVALK